MKIEKKWNRVKKNTDLTKEKKKKTEFSKRKKAELKKNLSLINGRRKYG